MGYTDNIAWDVMYNTYNLMAYITMTCVFISEHRKSAPNVWSCSQVILELPSVTVGHNSENSNGGAILSSCVLLLTKHMGTMTKTGWWFGTFFIYC